MKLVETSTGRLCDCGYMFAGTVCTKCRKSHPVFGEPIELLFSDGKYQTVHQGHLSFAYVMRRFGCPSGLQTIIDLASAGF